MSFCNGPSRDHQISLLHFFAKNVGKRNRKLINDLFQSLLF